jgi:hypothetical protein
MFDTVISDEEMWWFQYDQETKCLSMQWKTQNSTCLKKSTCLTCKTMLVCFLDHRRIVHYKFIAQGETVNQQCYLEVLTRLQECVQRKRPKLWPDKWILHHDDPAHDALKSS